MLYVKQSNGYSSIDKNYDSAISSLNNDIRNVANNVNSLVDKINESLTFKEYKLAAYQNSYVAPYTHYLNWALPASDITNIGTPISVNATGNFGQALPASLYKGTNPGEYSLTLVSTSEQVSVTIVFLDVYHILW